MRNAEPSTLREFETWLALVAGERELPERHRWKAWFCVAEYERPDFERVARTLETADAGGSFAFLGRDAHDQAATIESLDAAGHEIVFHSHRHHGYGSLSYDEAHDAITTGLEAIEDATGVTPAGFFVPLLDLSEGAARAIEEVGFEWVLGDPARSIEGVDVTKPVVPFDASLLEDHSPAEAMARLREEADAGAGPFLFHPPVIEFYDGLDEFAGWVDTVAPVSVAEQIERGGPGMVLDCVRPVRVD